MLEVIFGISILELIATVIIMVDFGPETVRKVKKWGSKDHWFR